MAAAAELAYRNGLRHATLADIAKAADVPAGNVYYYFKTKDDIVTSVTEARVAELGDAFAELERTHRSPRARLKALVTMVGEQREQISQFGCQYGTLASELIKRPADAKSLAGQLVETLIGWAERQFRALGRCDARALAVELIAGYQGAAIVASALGDAELFAGQIRRLRRWIDGLAADAPAKKSATKPKG